MRPVRLSAPTRVDLAGGTLDIWPLYLVVPGAVTVNLAIDRPARVRVTPRRDGRLVCRATDLRIETRAGVPADLGPELPLHREILRALGKRDGLTLATRSNVPKGSGLGGSSSLAVAAIRAVSLAVGRGLRRSSVIALARDVEAIVLQVPTGVQDHYAAAYGGLAALHLDPGEITRERLLLDPAVLVRRLVLAVVGESRLSATTNWDMLKAAVDGAGEARERFGDVAAAARAMRDALLGRRIDDVAAAMNREYEARRGLVPGVETPEMVTVRDAALAAGALAAKVCGAGGGGGMLFLAGEGRKSAIARAVTDAGARVLPLRADTRGLSA